MHCLSCGELMSAPVAAETRRVRCRNCGAVYTSGDEDGRGERRPRPLPRKKSNLLLISLLVGGGLVVLIGAVVLVWVLRGKRIPDSQVTAADLDKIEIFMPKAQVEAVLGPGREADLDDIHGNWVQAGQQAGATLWYEWRNGPNSLFVGFGQGRTGIDRAVISFFVDNSGRGGVLQETKTGFIHLNLFGSDLDDLAGDHAQEKKLLRDPRWLKGPAVRQALIGQWVAFGAGSYEFKEDSTCRENSPGNNFSGTYRFTDDDHMVLTMKGAPLFPGQQVQTQTRNLHVLVDANELILIDDRFPKAHPIVYQKQK